MPTIYIDADAVPRVIRDVLFRAAEKRGATLVFVANSTFAVPSYGDISFVQVEQGPDEADDWIAERAGAGDLVVTQDVPLAARVVPKGAAVVQTNSVSCCSPGFEGRHRGGAPHGSGWLPWPSTRTERGSPPGSWPPSDCPGSGRGQGPQLVSRSRMAARHGRSPSRRARSSRPAGRVAGCCLGRRRRARRCC